MLGSGLLFGGLGLGSFDYYKCKVDAESSQPDFAEPIQVWPWVAHLLNEPKATVESCKGHGMQGEVDDSSEMLIGRVGCVGVAVPANWHEQCPCRSLDCGAWMRLG